MKDIAKVKIPSSLFAKSLQTYKILLLGVVFLFCMVLLYYAAALPFAKTRTPQSLTENKKNLKPIQSWSATKAHLFYTMAIQAYQGGEYEKAKYYWHEALKLHPPSKPFENLGRAVEEAMVLKTFDIEKLKIREARKTSLERVELHLKQAKEHIKTRQWDLATIAYQEALLMDPENSDAKNGISDIEHLKHSKEKIVQKPNSESQTLKTYNTIRNHLKTAKKFTETLKYAAALREYKHALTIARHDDLNIDEIMIPFAHTTNELQTKTEALWKEADGLTEAGQYGEALHSIQKILHMNPKFKPAMNRYGELKTILEKKAQTLYSQAVIFEALPDIEAAKTQWKNILSLLSPSEPYYQKARQKLSKYISF